jgi:4-hydroxy-2-oxoheptanedioate aldolase
MNSLLRERILEEIKCLRDECGCVAIKAEFEAEGSRTEELVMLTDLVRRANVSLTLKIGGCEAARDLDQARMFDAESIMAPMVETPYALSKFRGVANKVFACDVDRVNWIVNAETKTCHANLDEILEEGNGFLSTVCIGRSDLSGSMGLSDQINGQEMFDTVKDIAVRSKAAGFNVTFGGKVVPAAVDFVSEMSPYVDAYETRKVTFKSRSDRDSILNSIEHALEFETLYLELKKAYYKNMAVEDDSRLTRLDSSK